MKTRSCVHIPALSCAALALFCGIEAFAMGSSPPSGGDTPNPLPTSEPIIGGALKKNNYIVALMERFEKAKSPVSMDESSLPYINDVLPMGKRLDCKTFYSLVNDNPNGPSTSGRDTWYTFAKFGSLMVRNLAWNEGLARIYEYAPNHFAQYDLWGQTGDLKYLEAIRVTPRNEVIIESFSPKPSWAEVILALVNAYTSHNVDELKRRAKEFAIQTSILGADGYILSYTYCPNEAEGFAELDAQVSRMSLQ